MRYGQARTFVMKIGGLNDDTIPAEAGIQTCLHPHSLDSSLSLPRTPIRGWNDSFTSTAIFTVITASAFSGNDEPVSVNKQLLVVIT